MHVWITSYLKDILCIPIIATICLHVIWLIRGNKKNRLSVFTIICLVIMYSIYFEYLLPKNSDFYIADIYDVFCYALGGIVFYILQRKE